MELDTNLDRATWLAFQKELGYTTKDSSITPYKHRILTLSRSILMDRLTSAT